MIEMTNTHNVSTATFSCPCCGHRLERPAAAQHLRDVALSLTKKRILEALIRAYPRYVTTTQLVDAVYADDVAGGPDDAPRVLSVVLFRLRRDLQEYGWSIPKSGTGYGTEARYRLEPMEAGRDH